MKYLTIGLAPTDRALHPVDGFIGGHDGVERDALLHIDARVDRTTVLLYQLTGDAAELDEGLADHPTVRDHELVAVDDETLHAFVLVESDTGMGRLVELAHDHALIVDTPIAYDGDEVTATLVGTHDNLRAALGGIPDDLTFAVRDAGEYAPYGRDLLSPLTERQLEVFRTAVKEGYYDVPRGATHADIAGVLECAPSTVDEHLRKAESRVVTNLMEHACSTPHPSSVSSTR